MTIGKAGTPKLIYDAVAGAANRQRGLNAHVGVFDNGNLVALSQVTNTLRTQITSDGGDNWVNVQSLSTDVRGATVLVDSLQRVHLAYMLSTGVYYRLGLPNAGRTEISWSSAHTIDTSGQYQLWVNQEVFVTGSESRVMVWWHYAQDDTSFDHVSRARPVTVDLDDVVTVGTLRSCRTNVNRSTIGADGAIGVPMFTSASAGRIWEASNMSGSYDLRDYEWSTWNGALSTTSRTRENILKHGSALRLSDGTRFTVGGTGTNGYLVFYEHDPSHVYTNRSVTISGLDQPIEGSTLCFSDDPDVLVLFFTSRKTVDTTWYLFVREYTISTNTWSSVLEIVASGSSAALNRALTATKHLAQDDRLYVTFIGANDKQYLVSYFFNTPPNPPTNLTRANYDARDEARFTWVFADDDPGDYQTEFKLRIREQGTGTWYYAQSDGTLGVEVWVVSADEFFDLAAAQLVNGKTYEWSVNTKDEDGEEGTFATEVTFNTARMAARAVIISPATDHDVVTVPQSFVVQADSDDDTDCTVEIDIDLVATFDSGGLIQISSTAKASWAEHTLTQALLGSTIWYWRARAKRGDATPGDWAPTRTLNVDTGGAVPTGITPDPVELVPIADNEVVFVATVDHSLTPTQGATLRLQGQLADTNAFLLPDESTSGKVLGGQDASITFTILVPGVYWIRFRTLADHGDDSAWDTYEATFAVMIHFVEDEPSWQAQVGARPNRVYVRIQGGTTVLTAEVIGVSANHKVDKWIEVPSGTSSGEAQATADAVLAVLQSRPAQISGNVPLSVTIGFENNVAAQWWERGGAGYAMFDSHTLGLAAKKHNIDNAITEVSLGDYAPPPEETIARMLVKLARKR